MYDGPGVRVECVASKDIEHGAPCIENGLVGFAAKIGQLDRFVRPDDAEATLIAEDEDFVLFVGGVHELALAGGLSDVAVGQALYLDPDDNTVLEASATDAVPLGVVQSIDASRTPDVARVNTNAWQVFGTVSA